MRLLFFGSPLVAVPFLETCARSGAEIAAVITQPDRPSGRGMKLSPPPVKIAARKLGLEVLQPERMSEVRPLIERLNADMAVVAAFGRMLGPKMLASTKHGFLNLHFSLLPEYRGAAPVQRALMDGKPRTGVTLFWIVEEMDAGPIQRAAALDVGEEEDAPALFKRLIALGASELGGCLEDIAAGRIRREAQIGPATFAPKISASESRLDFSLAADVFHNRVRGLRGGPKAYLNLRLPSRGIPVRLTLLKTRPGGPGEGPEGAIAGVDGQSGILVQCRIGRCWIVEVQPEGKKPLKAVDFLNGARLRRGDRLTTAA